MSGKSFLALAALVAGVVVLPRLGSAPDVTLAGTSVAAADAPEPAGRAARPRAPRPETPPRRPARRPAPVARPARPARPQARPAPPPPPRPAPAPARPVVRVPVPAPAPPVPPAPSGPTSWPALNRVIARIPSYHGTGARWVVESKDGFWGTADLANATVYIGRQVPERRLYDVAVHEWSHVLSIAVYDGDQDAAIRAMDAYFGGGARMLGTERAADCMAKLQGAEWTNYTACTDARWRAGAARLLAGQRL